MATSIHGRKHQQSAMIRELQQQKAEKKRELMGKQQQELTDLRQYYSDEIKKLEQNTADAIYNIKSETDQMTRDYAEDKKMRQQETRRMQEQARYEQMEAAQDSARQSSTEEAPAVYNRQGKKKPLTQNYETKSTDSFYRVQDRGSRVSENNNSYIIEAYAPEHEKDNLRVSVQKNKAVVSGKRKFGDTYDAGNKKLSTHNFQTFREEFKFNRPVSHEGMTRERVGDYVRFTIPKLEAIDTSEDEG